MKVNDTVKLKSPMSTVAKNGYSNVGKITSIDGYYIYVELINHKGEKLIVERYEYELELVSIADRLEWTA